MIEVQSLSRHYGPLLAVDGVSFTVREGEVLGFLGPNGAGKTSTMRILTGSLGASSGTVRVAGFDMRMQSKQARARIGYLPEQPPIYPSMTVLDYVDYSARLRGVKSAARPAAVKKALERTALGEVKGRLVGNLSKGTRQRVGLAQALVHEPPLLILDEPTSALDPAQVREIRSLIHDLRGKHTVVLSTHILSEVTATCDRVLILSKGRIVAQGTEEELRHSLGGARRLRLELARADGGTAAALHGVAGVRAVEDLGAGRFVVTLAAEDGREAVNTAAAPWGLLESRTEGGLEELYLKAVSGELEAGGKVPAPAPGDHESPDGPPSQPAKEAQAP
jgi:ABC-2 type transport system ATP-binding protein